MSGLDTPKNAPKPPALSVTSMNSRRDSFGSGVPSRIEKEQLAQQLDEIHNSASQSGALTTFNDFAAPSAGNLNPVETRKGISGDNVQTGFSGLYSRLKEAVGVASKPTDVSDVDSLERASKHSALALNTSSVTSLKGEAAPVSAHGTGSQTQEGSETPLVASCELLGTGMQSPKLLQATQPSGSNVDSPSLSTVPGKHSVAALAAASAGPATSLLNMKPTESMRAVASRPDRLDRDRPQGDGGKDVRVLRDSHPASVAEVLGSPINVELKTALTSDPSSTVPVTCSNGQDDAASISSSSGLQMSAIQGQKATMLPTLQDPSPNSSRVSLESIGARKPAIIEGIARSRSPVYPASRSSSMGLGMGGPEPNHIQTSAHNSVYHESFTSDSQTRQTGTGVIRIPGTAGNSSGGSMIINSRLQSVRNKMLSKDFWMADETCNECFACLTPFTAWRRKHHCRTCGRIFDSKCTSIIPAQRFGLSGTVRVCNICLDVINKRLDENSESEDSADDETTFFGTVFRLAKNHPKEVDPRTSLENISYAERGINSGSSFSKTPMMAIAATRRMGDNTSRSSAVLEIDAPAMQSHLSRPSSSRSLKSLAAGRPQSSAAHKRHHSKNLLGRFKIGSDERETAPFRKALHDDPNRRARFPAFHDDNVIDPDLAPFMSDESSGDEQISISAAMDSTTYPTLDLDKASFGTFFTAGKKHKMRQGEKSLSGLSFTSRGGGANEAAGQGSLISHSRPVRRSRNLSIPGVGAHHIRSPRPKSATMSVPYKTPTASTDALAILDTALSVESGNVLRSESISKPRPHIALGPASMTHVKKVLRQLLQDHNIQNPASWEKGLIPVLLKCTDDIEQNIHNGDDIDIRHYVKLKKIPGAKPSEINYVSGVIFTKKLALKTMPRSISNPRIVLVSFPIEYQRHAQLHFMSLQPVIEQEKEFLRVIVSRIRDLNPQIIFAEKNVSGVALQYLNEARITVAYNVKRPVIEALSRCCRTDIISSIDMLAIPGLTVGTAGRFDVKTYVNNDYPGRKKTYIFISGCDKRLGCTIALRGGPAPFLALVKTITEFMVYVVYNLRLESSFMQDSFVSVPQSVEECFTPPASRAPTFNMSKSAVEVSACPPESQPAALATRQSAATDIGSRVSEQVDGGEDGQEGENAPNIPIRTASIDATYARSSETQLPEDIPMPTFYSDMVSKYQTKMLSASPFVRFAQPHLLMKAREQERKLVYLRRLRDQNMAEEQQEAEDGKPRKFQLIRPEMVHETEQKAPKQIMEVLHAAHDAEHDKAMYHYQIQTRQWENSLQGTLDLFDTFSHQRIAVLYSVTCTETKIPCIEPSLVGISFYDELHNDPGLELDPDCTLGQYVEDLSICAEQVCHANGCGKRMHAHHRTYVHDEARITVFVVPPETPTDERQQEQQNKQQESDAITMWSYCKMCRKETPRRVMSEDTWKYSFGRFLELSFWCQGLTLADEIDCPHDYPRNHIRYFMFKCYTLRVHYDPIDLLEVIVPRARITWKVDYDLKLKNIIFMRIEERWNLFINSVRARITAIQPDTILPEKAQSCTERQATLMKKASEDHAVLVSMLQDAYMTSKYYEVIPMNRVIREMLEKAAEWDAAFSQFETDFLSDKDVRQIAILQLKKIFSESSRSVESTATTETATLVGSEPDSEKPTEFSLGSEEKDVSSQPISEKVALGAEEENYAEVSTEGGPTRRLTPPLVDTPLQLLTLSREAVAAEMVDSSKAANSINIAPLKSAETDLGTPEPNLPVGAESATPTSPTTPAPIVRTVVDCSRKTLSIPEKVQKTRRDTAIYKNGPLPAGSSSTGPGQELSRTVPERVSSRKAAAMPASRAAPQLQSSLPRAQSSLSKQGHREARNILSEAHGVPDRLLAAAQDALAKADKKPPEHGVFGAPKGTRKGAPSAIPRFVGKKKDPSKVSTLAKHFEQLSREWERERIRDRKQRAARLRDSRAVLPRSCTKAVVEVYDDVDQAVEEPESIQSPEHEDRQSIHREPSDPASTPITMAPETPTDTSEQAATDVSSTAVETLASSAPSEPITQPEQTVPNSGDRVQDTSIIVSDDEGSDEEADSSGVADELKVIAASIDAGGEAAGRQRTNLMKIITNFWAERSASCWPPLEYPLNATDHVFMDSDIIVREDEPSSLISFALSSEDYQDKLADIRHRSRTVMQKDPDTAESSEYSEELELEQSLLRNTGTHLKYQFQEGSARMLCKIFYAEQFDALRRKCGAAERIVESLSRCLKWDSKGGKTKSVFLKTLDDRLVMKVKNGIYQMVADEVLQADSVASSLCPWWKRQHFSDLPLPTLV